MTADTPRTIISRCTAGPRLVAENVRSWEWESFARREPRRARDRLSSLRGCSYIPSGAGAADGEES